MTSRSIASSSGSSSLVSNLKYATPPSFVNEAQRTLLYFRAVDAESPESILGDIYAKQLVNTIRLDIVDTMGQDLRFVSFWCLRAKRIDLWCHEFITEHPDCMVVNLSCGLDTRIQRLRPPSSVRWIDIDHLEVIEFRKKVFPNPGGDYSTLAVDISEDDTSWIYSIPNNRPTLVVAESNMFYLKPEVAKSIFYTIAEHFSYGQIVFDVLGSFCAALINMKMVPVQKKTGMKILWPVDDPHKVATIHPKIRFIDEMRYSQDMPPWFGEFRTKILKRLPGYRNLGRVILLGFEEQSRNKSGGEVPMYPESVYAMSTTTDPDYLPDMAEGLSRVSTVQRMP
ncbi:S-adenosyl-L-methionine-dependent methyltransferase [Stachybotrys elegans]|uniref:S-adenosyl-L-methionine-dependent methyltransferase n=1 Tax=Stachybotrys elegans TaxID=80388 RepID=A0A8K0SNS1_9HYPO|nr:S-adenosyl-L-methionine-dependent methyltransferase [Stachybotrys elegans]